MNLRRATGCYVQVLLFLHCAQVHAEGRDSEGGVYLVQSYVRHSIASGRPGPSPSANAVYTYANMAYVLRVVVVTASPFSALVVSVSAALSELASPSKFAPIAYYHQRWYTLLSAQRTTPICVVALSFVHAW